MLTVFSIPKAFRGHIGVIQRNALNSWIRLGQGVQVILFGNDDGVAEAAREAGAEHVSDIALTEFGTPLLNFAFSTAARIARNPLLCYVNGDIIFTDELIRAVNSIRKRHFVMVGRRWNVDIVDPWDFSDLKWREKLLKFAHEHGTLYRDDAIDYFVFPRDSKLTILPPFAVGRPGWDNYFLFRCRQLGYPLIDATAVVTAVHQNHDYAHVPNGTGRDWAGPEADANLNLIKDTSQKFIITDATHRLTESGLKRASDPEYSRRRGARYLALHPRQKVFVRMIVGIKAFFRQW